MDSADGDVIVDIKVSNTGIQDADLLRYGYIQVVPDFGNGNQRPPNFAALGTFGKGQSIWIWKRKQGTCSGRFKPVVDIQLDSQSTSTAKVLSGYLCIPVPVSGQWVWIKRATTEEEEKDAIVDVHVTIGKASNLADKIHQSPGVGWIKVGGNFSKGFNIFGTASDSFVWFRPARTRSFDSPFLSSLANPAGLSMEVRQAIVLENMRKAIRHHVPLQEVKRLATLQMEEKNSTESNKAMLRSDRMFDFSALYHMYDDSGKGRLTLSKLSKMLSDVGSRLESADINRCFYFFNCKLDGYISREEYSNMLSLTDYEIDLVVDKIRNKLLASVAATVPMKVNGPKVTSATPLRENISLSNTFNSLNIKEDGILSLDEILDLASDLEIFLTEEEGRKLMRMMDINGDDRVEEGDFIEFMKKRSEIVVKKAVRIRESAASFRRWLKETGGKLTPNDNITNQLWLQFKTRHQKSSQSKFPGYLTAEDVMLVLATNGNRLSITEARELGMLVGPEADGRINQEHLKAFVDRSCRSFGEIIAILERDLLKKLVDPYKEYHNVIKTGGKAPDLYEKFSTAVKEVVRQVQGAYIVVSSSDSASSSKAQERSRATQDVVSLMQLKAGVEVAMRGFQTPEAQLPNVEEWACLSCLVNAIVAENNTYGIKLTNYFELLCAYIVEGAASAYTTTVTLDIISRDLQRMIKQEANIANKGKGYNYKSVFNLFDLDGEGSISAKEFKEMLVRLKLVNDLPESQLPLLMAKFDKKKSGFITYDDFIAFVESNKEVDIDNSFALTRPNEAITKSKDCDDFIWHLWKQCYLIEPNDPEGIVTELEALCTEIENTTQSTSNGVTVKDFWNLLNEIELKGDMSRQEFERGVAYVCHSNGNKPDEDYVDYIELCRYVVRMGRRVNSEVQEKKSVDEKLFEQLYSALRRELSNTISSSSEIDTSIGQTTVGDKPQFEKVFYRLDTDGDGRVTPKEFLLGLQRLQVSDVKSWDMNMVQRLFDELDANHDGYLNLKEFNLMIYDGDHLATTGNRINHAFLSDDDDDAIFSKNKVTADTLLYRKTSDVLYENVPTSSAANHTDEVKAALRLFFNKSDPDKLGMVSEERFKVFCHRSGLNEGLSTEELRRLTDKLRSSGKKGVSIEYDKLIRNLVFSRENALPKSKAEYILSRLSESAGNSAAAGRPFIALCSLVDSNLTGRITVEELIHTVKMMGATISIGEIETLKYVIPGICPSKLDGSIDYKELHYQMQNITPRSNSISNSHGVHGLSIDTKNIARGMTPIFQQSPSTPFVGISTPGGMYLQTPHEEEVVRGGLDGKMKTGTYVNSNMDADAKERTLQVICNNVKIAVNEKMRQLGAPFSLLRQFEVFDAEGTGHISIRTFQGVLDDLGVMLTSGDTLVVQSIFGRPEDDKVSYDAFCHIINLSNTANSRGIDVDAPYINPRMQQRLKELKADGRDPRHLFESMDADNCGLIDVRKFRDVINRTQLLQSENQLLKAIDHFASLSDKALIVYDDFCRAIESSLDRTLLDTTVFTKSKKGSFVYGSGYDGLRSSRGNNYNTTTSSSNDYDNSDPNLAPRNVERWLRSDATPKDKRDFSKVYESLQKFKQSQSNIIRDFPNELEDGTETAIGGGFGPKLSESISLSRSFNRPPLSVSRYSAAESRQSWNRESWDDQGDRSPVRNSKARSLYPESPSRNTPVMPRTSPSKVGSIIWGRDMPISQKGRIPKMDDGNWVCAVCLYVENPLGSSTCNVCDSPNYTARKDFQVKEQCSNCTFLNGQFAVECEMCGEPLSRTRR